MMNTYPVTINKTPITRNSRLFCGVVLLLLFPVFLQAQTNFRLLPGVDAAEDRWVDSTFMALTPEQRLGQLFVIRAHSDLGAEHIAQVERQIREYKVGGLCFFQGTPEKQLELINRYQRLSGKLPLMISIDGEWGLGMRMKASTISFPRQLMLGAIQNNDLIYAFGREVGKQMKMAGVHLNYAPVVDVNNNPDNPVINTRSFGEDRYNVAVKSYMYMRGMQDEGVMACAKHFPGHGDTDVDSHLDLPVITHSRERLDSVELYPFRILAKRGIGSMMVAHLSVPALDARKNRPTTLSRNTITSVLRQELDFHGLIMTDALEMKGVTKHFKPGETEAEALLAGNDILLLPEDTGAALKEIRAWLGSGKLSQAQLDESVKRILRAKYRLRLTQTPQLNTANIRARLNNKEAEALRRQLIQNALTMVRNKEAMIPFTKVDELDMATLSIGATKMTPFQNRLASYKQMLNLQLPKEIPAAESNRMLELLERRDVVIVGLHDMSQYSRYNFGLTRSTLNFLQELNKRTKVVLTVFGNPYSLKYFDNFEWVLMAYEEDRSTQDLAAQGIFGVFSMQGRLPVTASERSRFNAGQPTTRAYRMGYSIPEAVGLNSDTLALIDEIMAEAIRQKATPGGVVLVAKNGQIVFEKAYGHHTYLKKKAVQTNDVFDLASVTKIAATTLSVMKLHEQGKLNVEMPLSNYLPALQGTNKQGLLIRDIMAHHAGLEPWIPFFEQTLAGSSRNPQPSKVFYRNSVGGDFVVPVVSSLFMDLHFRDSIWQQIYASPLRENNNYRYSDLGFYLLAETVQALSGQAINEYAGNQFYEPMGLSSTTYNPWKREELSKRIVPTEEDRYWRRRQVRGYVHDMGAAMLGGVSGHAGLFAQAEDLAVLMQMLLNGGVYGGQRYLQPETIELFTRRHVRSTRRGIGFDMKELNPGRSQNMAPSASTATFGHLGFTGTCTWVDPEQGIVYVFLSNRTYPSMYNYKLNKLDTRPRIQETIYNALMP